MIETTHYRVRYIRDDRPGEIIILRHYTRYLSAAVSRLHIAERQAHTAEAWIEMRTQSEWERATGDLSQSEPEGDGHTCHESVAAPEPDDVTPDRATGHDAT